MMKIDIRDCRRVGAGQERLVSGAIGIWDSWYLDHQSPYPPI